MTDNYNLNDDFDLIYLVRGSFNLRVATEVGCYWIQSAQDKGEE